MNSKKVLAGRIKPAFAFRKVDNLNIVVVWSSPNKDGLTASAKESFLRGIRKTLLSDRLCRGNRPWSC